MCGRFALFTPPARLARYFDATLGDDLNLEPSYNVAPTDPVFGVRAACEARRLDAFRWGLVTPGSASAAGGGRLFNARAETLASRPSYRTAYEQRRLIVPADGFYEWHTQANGAKQPHFFHRSDGAPLAFAGLWAEWRPPGTSEPGSVVRTCTIVTTDASEDMDAIHDRMPVLLSPDTVDVWLDPGFDRDELGELLRPPPTGTLVHHAVDRRVGNVRFNSAELIEPVDHPGDATQLSLLEPLSASPENSH